MWQLENYMQTQWTRMWVLANMNVLLLSTLVVAEIMNQPGHEIKERCPKTRHDAYRGVPVMLIKKKTGRQTNCIYF